MRTRKGRKIKRYKTRVLIDLDEIRKQVNRAYNLPDNFDSKAFIGIDFGAGKDITVENYQIFRKNHTPEVNQISPVNHILNLMNQHIPGRRC